MELSFRQKRLQFARVRFATMACTYFLGVFNDNFFKQAVMLLAVAAGRPEMQGYAMVIFTAPFILFAAPAGWLADRYPKNRVVIGAKWFELVAMLFGAAGICTGHWLLIFTMLGIMGLQATIFSPALNGAIPELYPADYVPRANGILRVLITAAILTGIACSGISLGQAGPDWHGVTFGRMLVAAIILLVAGLGVLVSYGIPHRNAASPKAPFPWHGPVDTFRHLRATRQDPLLATAIFAGFFIWFAGSLQLLIINPLGLQQMGLGSAGTSGLIVAQLAGIAVGGLISGKLRVGRRWNCFLVPSSLTMGVLMGLVMLIPGLPVPFRLPVLVILIHLIGIAGGIFLIPVESFIQVRPPPGRKGATWAAANFVIFTGILLSGVASNWLNLRMQPTESFGIIGLLSLSLSGLLWAAFRKWEER